MSNINSVKIRMYRHGFGDCFLLQYFSGKTRKYTMLIDCGLKLNDSVPGITLANVRDDIAKVLKGKTKSKAQPKLDLLVVTHEHWDHVSGFHPKQALFDKFNIGKLWLAWTENPEDDDAKVLNKSLRKRIKALKLAADKLKKNTNDNQAFFLSLAGGDKLLRSRKDFDDSLQGLVNFFGPLATTKTKGGISVKDSFKISLDTQDAMDHVRTFAKKSSGIVYHDPGDLIDDIKELPGMRVYVLGPPKNKLLNKEAPSKGAKKEVYFGDNVIAGFVEAVIGLSQPETGFTDAGRPFGNSVKSITTEMAAQAQYLAKSYFNISDDWRRIDEDWLDMAGALALQMDSDTNNTSLVLAIEFISSGKILLFPGDAQVGNWLSWHEHEWEVKNGSQTKKVNAKNILNNTVFYKVGHHASHNATLKEKGLEMMIHDELVAFVPEKEKQYKGIPFTKLMKRLREKAKGRVLVSADKNNKAEKTLDTKPDNLSAAEWKAFNSKITITPLFIEYTVDA